MFRITRSQARKAYKKFVEVSKWFSKLFDNFSNASIVEIFGGIIFSILGLFAWIAIGIAFQPKEISLWWLIPTVIGFFPAVLFLAILATNGLIKVREFLVQYGLKIVNSLPEGRKEKEYWDYTHLEVQEEDDDQSLDQLFLEQKQKNRQ